MSKHNSDRASSKDTSQVRLDERSSNQDSRYPEAWVDAHAYDYR